MTFVDLEKPRYCSKIIAVATMQQVNIRNKRINIIKKLYNNNSAIMKIGNNLTI